MVLKLCINLVITKYRLKSQFKLTQLWPFTVNWVLSLIWQDYQNYVSSAHMETKCLYKRDYCFALNAVLSNMFFQIFSNVFTNILKIYELPKIYNKILKKLLTISSTRSILCHNFIWYLRFIENIHLGAKDFFGTKFKKNPR